MKAKGLEKIDDVESLKTMVRKVIEDSPEKVEAYRSGKTGLLGFFMGQIMREAQGKADPKVVQELVRTALEEEES